jgi:hypothetical protein
MARGEELLERIAVAVEALAIDPEIEINAGPPVCPSCNAFDPNVTLPFQEGGTGPMSQIIVKGTCQVCSNPFYIVIESYSVHKTLETAGTEIKEREKAGFFKQ